MTSIGKTIFVSLKVLIILVMMGVGMYAHYSRSNKINRPFRLFIFYAFTLLLLCYYEFISQKIRMLYLLIVLSGIGQLASIYIFVEKAKYF